MKRFYLTPVIGTGTIDDPYRAAVRDASGQGASTVAVIPTDANGVPTFPYALCLISAPDHTVYDSVGNTDRFPDLTLDSQLSVLTNQQRNALLNFLSKRGIETNGINNNTTFGEVVTLVGQHLDTNFNVLKFDAN
jgi:hypothetical protein